jgi:hypothetical protein
LEEISCVPFKCMHNFHIAQVTYEPLLHVLAGQLDPKNVQPQCATRTLEIHSISVITRIFQLNHK